MPARLRLYSSLNPLLTPEIGLISSEISTILKISLMYGRYRPQMRHYLSSSGPPARNAALGFSVQYQYYEAQASS